MKKTLKILSLFIFLILVLIGYDTYQTIGQSPTKERLKSFEKLPYFQNEEFQSLKPITYEPEKVRNGPAGFARFFTKSKFAPNHSLPKVMLTKDSFPKIPKEFSLFWLGHSSAIMELNQKRIIFDPVLGNAAPLFFAVPRFDVAPIKRDDLPEIDYVVITHNHYDHLEKQTIQKINTKHFIVPLGVKQALIGWGIEESKITELGWKEEFVDGDFKFIAREGVHYSGRSSWDKNKTLWNSYVILSKNKKIFWGGDTGYGDHFKKIGQEYGKFDFAALEIDGWNPAWRNTHLFPNEIIQAMKDLNSKILLPIHWGVFDLALHPWHESIDMVLEEAKNTNIDVKTPKMGQKIDLSTQTSIWWK